GHAAHHELPDATRLEDGVHVGGVERALPGLVDDRFTSDRIDLVDDVMTVLTANEQASHRANVADVDLRPATLVFRGRQVGQVGPVALARMDDEQAGGAAGLEDPLGGGKRLEQERGVVSERLAEAARVHEVSLEIDHDQCGRLRIELEFVGFRLGGQHLVASSSYGCACAGSGRIRVPVAPAMAFSSAAGVVMRTSWPPRSRKWIAASTLGPMEP